MDNPISHNVQLNSSIDVTNFQIDKPISFTLLSSFSPSPMSLLIYVTEKTVCSGYDG